MTTFALSHKSPETSHRTVWKKLLDGSWQSGDVQLRLVRIEMIGQYPTNNTNSRRTEMTETTTNTRGNATENHTRIEAVTPKPRFEKTACSQCGREFGPGDHGFSHCSDHRRIERYKSRKLR